MLKKIKSPALPKRERDSHKGDNGRVLIVGGSAEYYGAPVLSALAALHSGADLVYLYVPSCIYDTVRSFSPDFIVRKYDGDYLAKKHVKEIVEFGKKCDSVLIGPGLGETEGVVDAARDIIKTLHIPTVLDANAIVALKKFKKFPLEQEIVVTPHRSEFNELIGREVHVDAKDTKSIIFLRSLAMDLHINVLLKGATDYVASEEGDVELNLTGHEGMTVGGSGDVLAGVVAGFVSQGLEGFDAARAAAFYCGRAGELLGKEKGYGYTASDLAEALPLVIK